jgi:hypothetical protein
MHTQLLAYLNELIDLGAGESIGPNTTRYILSTEERTQFNLLENCAYVYRGKNFDSIEIIKIEGVIE